VRGRKSGDQLARQMLYGAAQNLIAHFEASRAHRGSTRKSLSHIMRLAGRDFAISAACTRNAKYRGKKRAQDAAVEDAGNQFVTSSCDSKY
jgi:hypothetical protein